VGLGRDDRPHAAGQVQGRRQDVNPQWNIPESIRQEHIRERDDARRFIRGGAPDNPLAAIASSRSLAYSIHGTTSPGASACR